MKNMEQFSVFLRLHSEVNLRNLCHLESKSLTGDLLDVIYVQVWFCIPVCVFRCIHVYCSFTFLLFVLGSFHQFLLLNVLFSWLTGAASCP